VLFALAPFGLDAQVPDGGSATYTNATNSFQNVTIGTNGSFALLTLGNNTLFSNVSGTIGLNSVARSNEVRLISPTARWLMGGALCVGLNGSGNQLVVSNGATVLTAGQTTVGSNLSATANSIIATGPGTSFLVGAGVVVGSYGNASRLTITNGAVMTNQITVLGQNLSSSNNVAVVIGNGSAWTNSGPLHVGGIGPGNQLLIANGGTVRDAFTYLGVSASSSSNHATVIGPGSIWAHTGQLHVGFGSVGNQLTVSNGGYVGNTYAVVGIGVGANSNLATVTGGGSVWSNASILNVGSEGIGNRLIVSDGGAVYDSTGTIGLLAGDNTALITDAGSRWTHSLDLFVGNASSRNLLIVSNGATVSVGSTGQIGYNSGANSNSAVVTGMGTRWLLSSNLYIGSNGAVSGLIITNGAWTVNESATLGVGSSSSNNAALVTGAGSGWSNRQTLVVGQSGVGNRVVISNGAQLENRFCILGADASSSNNVLIVTDPGSVWRIEQGFAVGSLGGGNRLVITNGGQVQGSGTIGSFSANNEVVVTGSGSSWTSASSLNVGSLGGGNRLLIQDGAEVVEQPFDVVIGAGSQSTNNRIVVDGGTLRVVISSSALDIRRGTNVLNAGLIDVGRLMLTNALGFFEFNGGKLVARSTTHSNGRVFTVGNGSGAALFQLQGGAHSFADGLAIADHASLIGDGTVFGTVNVLAGGTLSPGASIGKLTLNNSPILQGSTFMEISRNGSVLTNDEIQVSGLLAYGGALAVTNLGSTPLAAGDRFRLFHAGVYAGNFPSVSLPPLGLNLNWTNKLAVDGSIEVIGASVPQFDGISRAGTNLVLSGKGGIAGQSYGVLTTTNVALPLNQWASIATNQFGVGGSFSLTNGINPATPQRFFRIRWP